MGDMEAPAVNYTNCRTRVKMDDLWECLTEEVSHCPDRIAYGPTWYCVNKNRSGFSS